MIADHEIIADLFAGGGGASLGIFKATGRHPDIAINHDPIAIAMHRANHPSTHHFCQDVWKVLPRQATSGRPVGLLWASPDCTFFSKAKGGAPIRDVQRRELAWVVVRWAEEVKPGRIFLENVEEFTDWGPVKDGKVIQSQKGTSFVSFVRSLRKLGYMVEWKELRACDFGAPTIRKRLFLVARNDRHPIIWPEPTHGPGRIPYRTAGDIIDWSIPCPSIFGRKKPLAVATLRRIANGITRYVIEDPNPFVVTIDHRGSGDSCSDDIQAPLSTITGKNRHVLVLPYFVPRHGEHAHQSPRIHSAQNPYPTVTCSNNAHLVAAFLAQHNTGVVGHSADEPLSMICTSGSHQQLVACHLIRHFGNSVGQPIDQPAPTVMSGVEKTGLVATHLVKLKGTSRDGQSMHDPLHTVQAGGQHYAEVRAFLVKYFGNANAQSLSDPLHTITSRDRYGLVTVTIGGIPHVIVDIGMRMLSPRELFRAQGFGDDYIIDVEVDGKPLTKSDQVRLCGNSVSPDNAEALISANIQDDYVEHSAGRHLLQLNMFAGTSAGPHR